MLFAWLFAVFVSWANACIVQPSGEAQDLRGHPERSGHFVVDGAGHGDAADAGGSPAPDPARQACASFCDTEQSIVAKAQPAKGDGAAEPSAMAVPGFVYRPAFTPGQAVVHWRPRAAPPPPQLPVAIAFLRLTL